MTFDTAVEQAKMGELLARPGFPWKYFGFDDHRRKLYTVDLSGHKAQYHPFKADREATDWTVLSGASAPR